MRDAAVAAVTLNIFNNRCDVVKMANIAQLCNNLHSLYLAGGDQFVETPNYHVYAMYRPHMGAKQLETKVLCRSLEKAGFDAVDTLSASASLKDGRLTVTVVNMDVATSKDVSFTSVGGRLSGKGEMTLLYTEDPQTCNTFEEPYAVKPVTHAVSLSEGSVITLPPACIAQINLKLGEE